MLKKNILNTFSKGLEEFYGTIWSKSALNIEINSTRISNPTQSNLGMICNIEINASIKLFNEEDLYDSITYEFLKSQCFPEKYLLQYKREDMEIKGILSIEHLEEVRDTGFYYKITIKLLHGRIQLHNTGGLCL